jgi:two-component system response regulator RegA
VAPAAQVRTVRMLVVDDDDIFRTRLQRALAARGIETFAAANASEAQRVGKDVRPQWALVDLRMPGMNGLELVKALHAIDENMQIVVLTGYGTIATAVEAVRAGAADYLTKPVDTDQILAAFDKARGNGEAEDLASADAQTPSLARVEWDYIHRVLSDCGGNISQAARKLGIHRRSLQRKLQKLPPLE